MQNYRMIRLVPQLVLIALFITNCKSQNQNEPTGLGESKFVYEPNIPNELEYSFLEFKNDTLHSISIWKFPRMIHYSGGTVYRDSSKLIYKENLLLVYNLDKELIIAAHTDCNNDLDLKIDDFDQITMRRESFTGKLDANMRRDTTKYEYKFQRTNNSNIGINNYNILDRDLGKTIKRLKGRIEKCP